MHHLITLRGHHLSAGSDGDCLAYATEGLLTHTARLVNRSKKIVALVYKRTHLERLLDRQDRPVIRMSRRCLPVF